MQGAEPSSRSERQANACRVGFAPRPKTERICQRVASLGHRSRTVHPQHERSPATVAAPQGGLDSSYYYAAVPASQRQLPVQARAICRGCLVSAHGSRARVQSAARTRHRFAEDPPCSRSRGLSAQAPPKISPGAPGSDAQP
eukprot:1902583-Prymnesium_polylepis.1